MPCSSLTVPWFLSATADTSASFRVGELVIPPPDYPLDGPLSFTIYLPYGAAEAHSCTGQR